MCQETPAVPADCSVASIMVMMSHKQWLFARLNITTNKIMQTTLSFSRPQFQKALHPSMCLQEVQ